MCLYPKAARSSYRVSISWTTHCNASEAFLGSVIIGVTRCGTPSYTVSSTRLGSTKTIRTSSGVARDNIEAFREVMYADLHAPAEPASSTCGNSSHLAHISPPLNSSSTPRDYIRTVHHV